MSSAATAATPAETARSETPLADGWRFHLGDMPAGVEQPGFADSAWPTVSVPHSWNRVGYYLPPSPDRVNSAATVDKTQGVGWYRLSFTPDALFRGKRAWLEFDAASRIATVWLNGVQIGEHKGGFSRFRIDATAALRPGVANVLAVRVDNSKPAPGATTADVLPLTGDFFVNGGLYRPVRLIATDEVHLDMMDAGGPGAYATTREIAGGTARVAVALKVRNDAARARTLRVVTRLLDATGVPVAEAVRTVRLGARTGADVAADLNVRDAHLWNGVADPYLYRLSVELRDDGGARRGGGGGGTLRDRVDQPFGIREMRVDPVRGFLLNGKPYALRGVGYHQDIEGKGWAITPADVARDLDTMQDMGANSIRLTHYQHGQTVHDEADRRGMILWDEIPLVSAWTLGDAKVATPALRANMRQQLTELIQQNRNHAAVAVWGIANEVDFGNSLPGFLTDPTGTPPDPMPILGEADALAKALDPARPTALANCCEGQVFAPGVTVPVTSPMADLGGANRYFGWYYGKPELVGPALDALHAKHPGQPLAITEYGAGGAVTMHTDDVTGGIPDIRGRLQPEEYESYVHERNWAQLRTRPWLWATWLWSGFDFASTVRHEGDAEDVNTKGLVTFDRTVRKDAWYFYKANWSMNPTVHITGRRYVDRAYPVTDVRVYSNAPRTELRLNGVSVGAMTDCPEHVCVWKDVRLAEGRNHVVARGEFAGTPVEDSLDWTVAHDVMRAIRIDSGALVAASVPGRTFGSDAFFSGGSVATLDTPGGFAKPPVAAVIAGTDKDVARVAATYRKGAFEYAIPLRDGRYRLTLTFVEPAAKPGERRFDVLAGDRVLIAALDVAAEAGAPMTAVRRVVPVTVTGGRLSLRFRPIKGDAIVSAVEVDAEGS